MRAPSTGLRVISGYLKAEISEGRGILYCNLLKGPHEGLRPFGEMGRVVCGVLATNPLSSPERSEGPFLRGLQIPRPVLRGGRATGSHSARSRSGRGIVHRVGIQKAVVVVLFIGPRCASAAALFGEQAGVKWRTIVVGDVAEMPARAEGNIGRTAQGKVLIAPPSAGRTVLGRKPATTLGGRPRDSSR